MITRARVDICILNNGTFQDAFQFGVTGDTSWSFTGKTFHMDVKASADDVAALLSMTTLNGRIVVDDVTVRVLHFNVPASVFAPLLPPAKYVYDLVMLDAASPAIRTALMGGTLDVQQGVTQS